MAYLSGGGFDTWFWMGTHCAGIVLRKKARRKGFNGCIHTALDGQLTTHQTGQKQRQKGITLSVCRSFSSRCGRIQGASRIEMTRLV